MTRPEDSITIEDIIALQKQESSGPSGLELIKLLRVRFDKLKVKLNIYL